MSGSQGWLIFLLIIWVAIGTLCVFAEGQNIPTTDKSDINIIGYSTPSIGSAIDIAHSLGKLTTWNFSFLQTGIGAWIRVFLCLLSISILLPIVIDLLRLVFHPLS